MENVWFDTAASPYLYQPDIYRHALELAGKDKVLMGTDFPLLKPNRYLKEMDAATLSATEKAAVCGLNAVNILKLS